MGPFNLYDSDEVKERKATREFRKCFKDFVDKWHELQKIWEDIGASDTASRDTQVNWIKKHAKDVW